MASGRSTNTMSEALVKLLTEVTTMKTLPDADVEWIIDSLETPILMKIREPLERMYASGASSVPPEGMPTPGGIPAGPMPFMPPGPTPSMTPGPPPLVGGIRNGGDMSGAVDELRRVMGGVGQ